jgi:hypothetical protein
MKMAYTIEYPSIFAREDTRHINNQEFPFLPIQADDDSVTQYCTETGATFATYEQDSPRMSNDGARLYNYYDIARSEWLNAWGYSAVVLSIRTM